MKTMKIINRLMNAEAMFWNSIILGILTLLFWLVETIIFLIIEGWHVTATHPVEVFCDGMSVVLFFIAKLLFLLSVVATMISIFEVSSQVGGDLFEGSTEKNTSPTP